MYLKIVPAAKLGENTVVLEVDRIDSRTFHGESDRLIEVARGFIERGRAEHKVAVPHIDEIHIGSPTSGEDWANGLDIRYEEVTVTLITAYRPSGNITLIAAMESDIYLMNDKGSSVDRIKGRSCL